MQKILEGKAKVIEEGLCGRTIMYDDPVTADRNGSRFLNCCLQSQQPLDLVIHPLSKRLPWEWRIWLKWSKIPRIMGWEMFLKCW